MDFVKTALKGVVVIEPTVYGDNRGWFMETYSEGAFKSAGLDYVFVQDNHSMSKEKGVLRGLHFQNYPMAQTKLVRCTKGKILDVAVDIRRGSDQYLQSVAVELSAENKRQLLIPQGFAHGFVTLTDDVEVQYKVDNLYNKECDRGIRYDDPAIGVEWGVEAPVLSQKDTQSPLLRDSDCNFTIRVLVTGANGQLGQDVMKKLQREGYQCKGIDIDDCDLTDEEATLKTVKAYRPDVIVHCAAYTAVDRAEQDSELCEAINVRGSTNVAKAAAAVGSKMVYISTDYVFNGDGDVPFATTDSTAPQSVYGRTKLMGEQAAAKITDKLFIVRTSWVFGVNGNNFVKTMLRLAESKKELSVVCDQIGSPTYTVDLADFIFYIINKEAYGTYHCTNEGFCSWADFARAIFDAAGLNVAVKSVTTEEYNSAARRPKNSRLDKSCLKDCGYGVMPLWQDALKRYLEELKK